MFSLIKFPLQITKTIFYVEHKMGNLINDHLATRYALLFCNITFLGYNSSLNCICISFLESLNKCNVNVCTHSFKRNFHMAAFQIHIFAHRIPKLIPLFCISVHTPLVLYFKLYTFRQKSSNIR